MSKKKQKQKKDLLIFTSKLTFKCYFTSLTKIPNTFQELHGVKVRYRFQAPFSRLIKYGKRKQLGINAHRPFYLGILTAEINRKKC